MFSKLFTYFQRSWTKFGLGRRIVWKLFKLSVSFLSQGCSLVFLNGIFADSSKIHPIFACVSVCKSIPDICHFCYTFWGLKMLLHPKVHKSTTKRVTQENTYLYLCLCLCIWENIYFGPGKRWTAIQRSLNGKLKISSKFIHFRFKICRFALFIKFLNRPFIIGSPSYLLWETLCKYFYLWCFDRSYTANVGRLLEMKTRSFSFWFRETE